MEEIWKEIEDTDGKYHVSSHGRLKSYAQRKEGKILKQYKNHKGYMMYCPLKLFVHRLVANAFMPNEDNSKTVNHINGIRNDNRIENLEWVTHSENRIHGILRLEPNKVLGVFKVSESKYRAHININGKYKHIGVYTTSELAHQAFKEYYIKHKSRNRYI